MKNLNYILQRVFSRRDLKRSTFRIAPVLRAARFRFDKRDIILFNFNHPTTHMGDRLFFIPLIKHLINSKVQVIVSDQTKAFKVIFETLYRESAPLDFDRGVLDSRSVLHVFPAPAFELSRKSDCIEEIYVDFTDRLIGRKISQELIFSFCRLLNLPHPFCYQELLPPLGTIKDKCEKNQKYFLFSNYVDSGRFRVTKEAQSALAEKALSLKNEGYKIIHIGSERDRLDDQRPHPFVDIDLRGKTSVEDLIKLTRASEIAGCVSFDNFIMHLIGINNKRAFVRFRGRFLKLNVQHHYKFVNNNFFSDESLLSYF